MGKIIDITNQKFGFLTALYPTKLNNRFAWHCKCDCGKEIDVDSNNLRTGKTKSCGCKTKELISKKMSKNLVGQRFGYLTVLEATNERSGGSIIWKCICDCGKECYIPTSNLSRKHTQSCGCKTAALIGEALHLDLLNKKFNQLTVIKKLSVKNQETWWLCECDCGNKIEVAGWQLTTGHVGSCGCLKSKGELKIKQLFTEANISFTTQASFDGCVSPTGHKLKFDFFVNNSYLIEFDGEQHYLQIPNARYTKEQLEKIRLYDSIKDEWCKANNIPLLRIKYDKLSTLSLDDLIL